MKWIGVAVFIIFLMGISTSCVSDRPGKSPDDLLENSDALVIVYHDDLRNVTCWIYDGYNAGGMVCMTDRQIEGE